jgi:tetratricopeptide (TPR) repeat protein
MRPCKAAFVIVLAQVSSGCGLVQLIHWGPQRWEAAAAFEDAKRLQAAGRNEEATQLYSKGLSHLDAAPQDERTDAWRADALYNLTFALMGMKRNQEAVSRARECVTSAERTGNTHDFGGNLRLVPTCRAALGRAYAATEQYQAAQREFEEVLGLCRASGDREGEALALYELGGIHAYRAEYDEAIVHVEEALRIAKKINHQKAIGVISADLVNVKEAKAKGQAPKFFLGW